jgi:hypothetical protein
VGGKASRVDRSAQDPKHDLRILSELSERPMTRGWGRDHGTLKVGRYRQ